MTSARPACACLTTLVSAGRKIHAARAGQLAQLGGGERLQDEPGPAGLRRLGQPLGQGGDRLASRDDHQDAVGHEPPHDEQQRAQRQRVGPVCVVDRHHHGPLVPQDAEQVEQPGAERDVPAGQFFRRLAGAPQQLVEHASGELALGLVAAGAQDCDVAGIGPRGRHGPGWVPSQPSQPE